MARTITRPPVAKRRPKAYFLEHQVADRYAPLMRRAFLDAINVSRRHFGNLHEAWLRGPSFFFNVIPWMEIQLDWLAGFRDALLRTLWASASVQAKALSVEKQREPLGSLGFSLDKTNPRAIQWAERHAAELVVDLSESSKEAIRKLITEMFTQGVSPDEAVRRLRQHIGLNARDSQALANFRRRYELENAQRLVDNRRLVSPDTIQEQTERYANRLLRHRTETIVRTESMTASNQGQNELWAQAEEQGFLRKDETMRAWIITPDSRLCPICAPMASDDKLTTLDQPFVLGDGSLHDAPPAHPDCRCAMGLVFPDERGAFHHPQA